MKKLVLVKGEKAVCPVCNTRCSSTAEYVYRSCPLCGFPMIVEKKK